MYYWPARTPMSHHLTLMETSSGGGTEGLVAGTKISSYFLKFLCVEW